MITGSLKSNWADRLPRGIRLVLLLLAGTLFLAGIAFILGFSVALSAKGGLDGRSFGVLGGAILVAALLGYLGWQLSAPWRAPEQSAFARRYTRMWLILFALGLPVGILLGVASEAEQAEAASLFTNGALRPGVALAVSGLLLLTLLVSAVVYHRAIDDHEEQAYLRATTGAFYFLAATFPTAWLLVRGGIVEPLGMGSAMLILLASFVVQTGIWAWLKFR